MDILLAGAALAAALFLLLVMVRNIREHRRIHARQLAEKAEREAPAEGIARQLLERVRDGAQLRIEIAVAGVTATVDGAAAGSWSFGDSEPVVAAVARIVAARPGVRVAILARKA